MRGCYVINSLVLNDVMTEMAKRHVPEGTQISSIANKEVNPFALYFLQPYGNF